jgi:hypothetical protein
MKRFWVTVFSASFLALGTCAVAKQSPSSPPADQPQPRLQLVAIGKQRIAQGKQAIVIVRGSENVALDAFAELVIARMTDDKFDPEKLLGQTILLVRSTRDRNQWNVFLGGLSAGDPQAMAENVFDVQDVLLSTAKEQVRVQIDSSIYRLKPGEVLLALG